MRFLRKPHPFIFNTFSVFLPSAVTLFVLLAFRPFDFDTNDFYTGLLWVLILTLVPAICVLLIVTMLRKLLPKTMHPDTWTIGKEILLFTTITASIALVIFLSIWFMGPPTDALSLLWKVGVRTVLIAFFPIIFLVLFEQYIYQRKMRKETQLMNEKLLKKQVTAPSFQQSLHRFEHENGKLALQLPLYEIAYLKSEGNYVEVHLSNGEKTLVRNRLKALEEQLPTTVFFRCHNRFLINLSHIREVKGNARNMQIQLFRAEEFIPVSRSKSTALRALVENN